MSVSNTMGQFKYVTLAAERDEHKIYFFEKRAKRHFYTTKVITPPDFLTYPDGVVHNAFHESEIFHLWMEHEMKKFLSELDVDSPEWDYPKFRVDNLYDYKVK